jgi:carbon monoxide dehydrogenase subunit G
MILEGQFTLPASIQQAWDTLLNPEVLATCVPGCEKLEVIDDKTYACIVAAKVGSISARFDFTAKFTEINAPKHLKAAGSGQEMSKLATFSMDMGFDLEELSPKEVQVSYRANVSIVGKLATFGDRIMKAKAKQVQEELTKALRERLTSDAAATPAAAAAEEEPAAAAEDEEPPEAPAATTKDEAPAAPARDEEPAAQAKDEAAPEAKATAAADVAAAEKKAADKAPAEKKAADKAPAAKKAADKAPAAKKAADKAPAAKKAAPGTSRALAKAPAGTSRAVIIKGGTPAIKVTFWEMITVFFVVLWEKITGLFKGNRK